MWRTTASPDDPSRCAIRASRVVVAVGTIVFALVVCRWRPWDLFDRAAFSSDFYDEQARSFLRLRLSVRPEVAGNEGFLIDGSTYLYYGPFLALVRLPTALFGDLFAGRLSRLSMIVGYLTLCTAAFHLVHDQVRGRTRVALRTAGFVAAVACSPALYLTGWVSVYHETELWAAAFGLWATVGMLRWLRTGDRQSALLTAGTVAAAILTRASVGMGIGMAIGMLALHRLWSDRRNRDTWTIIAGCIGGVVVHMGVNLARFGSLLGLPAERQVLSLQNPGRAAWFAGNGDSFFSLRFLPTTIVHYLRPDTIGFERLLPFIRFGDPAVNRGSYPVETITPSASITASATVLVVAAVVGLVLIVRARAWRWLVLTLGGFVAAVPTFTIGFIANRYLADMLPMLMVPAAFGFANWAPSSLRVRRFAAVMVIVAASWGLAVNVALATWTQNLKEPGFTEFRYRVDGWVFGDPAPGITDYEPGVPTPRDGIVTIVRGTGLGGETFCDGVYIAEQGRWVPLERSDGTRQITGSWTPAEGSSVVAAGDGWTLTANVTGDTARFSLDGVDQPITGDSIQVDRAGDAALRIVADEINAEFSVWVDDDLALFSFVVPPGGLQRGVDVRPGVPQDGALCRLLEDRR